MSGGNNIAFHGPLDASTGRDPFLRIGRFGEVSTFAGALLGVDYKYRSGDKNKRADLRRFALSNQNLNYDLLLREEISYLYFFLNLTM